MNTISYEQRKEIYAHALAVYGRDAQMVVAIEELSEVQKELCKVYRGKGDMEHLAEEIADATIMLEQMRYAFDLNAMVCRKMDEKIQRLDDNLAPEVDVARGCIVNPRFKTNADRIRTMSDKELAAFLAGKFTDHETEKAVQKGEVLTATYVSEMAHTWYAAWMQWLRQPAEENAREE